MKRLRARRPSVPLVLSMLALVFALGGSAVAANHFLITSKSQIAPSVLRQLARNGRRGRRGPKGPVGDKGPTGDKGATGDKGPTGDQGPVGNPGITEVAPWAVVNSDASVARSSGGVTSTANGTGTYIVRFGFNVTQCAYVATIGLSGSVGSSAPGSVTVVGRNGDANALYIQTFDPSGTLTNLGFHVIVLC